MKLTYHDSFSFQDWLEHILTGQNHEVQRLCFHNSSAVYPFGLSLIFNFNDSFGAIILFSNIEIEIANGGCSLLFYKSLNRITVATKQRVPLSHRIVVWWYFQISISVLLELAICLRIIIPLVTAFSTIVSPSSELIKINCIMLSESMLLEIVRGFPEKWN